MHEPAFDVFAVAARAPEAAALVHARGTMSYRELALLAQRALAWLSARRGTEWKAGSVPPVVPVLALPSVPQVAMTYALLAAGIAVVPVHPRLTHTERRRLLDSVRSELLVAPSWVDERTPSSAEMNHRTTQLEAPLTLLQTSGSSAAPRLACLSQRALLASVRASGAHLGWHSKDRWLLALPFAHIGGLAILLRCLAAGKTVVLLERDARVSGSLQLAEAVSRHQVSLLSLVPTQLEQLLALHDWHPPASLRAILVGGAACSEAALERSRARGLAVLPSYGMTETCSQIATRSLLADPTEAGVGRPLPGIELRIDRGVIEVRGELLFSGYWPERVERSPRQWFNTGDLGRLDAAGCLHVTGRSNELIITGGENVEPSEVEATLTDVCAPRRICVYGQQHALWGQLVIVALEGPPDAALLRRIEQVSGERLASFKRPRFAAFVPHLPELPSGKVARRQLEAWCADALLPLKPR